jgi:hypothetical protein
MEYSGLGRSTLYEAAAANPGLFRKNGTATIVDLALLDQLLDAMPVAEIMAHRHTAGYDLQLRQRQADDEEANHAAGARTLDAMNPRTAAPCDRKAEK